MSDSVFNKSFNTLGASMNFRQLRQDLTTSNIANADTPGYKAMRVDFEKALQAAADTEGTNAMTGSSGKHFSEGGGVGVESVNAEIYEEPDITYNNDLNTVDVESEMKTLAENQILYDATTKLLNKQIGMLKYAISEGGK